MEMNNYKKEQKILLTKRDKSNIRQNLVYIRPKVTNSNDKLKDLHHNTSQKQNELTFEILFNLK